MRANLPLKKVLKNMEQEEAVKTSQEAVTDNGVENAAEAKANAPEGDFDLESEWKALMDAKIQAEKERDNYKNGLLVAKGKKSIADFEEEEQETIQETIAKTVKQELAATKYGDLVRREQELIQRLVKENKELKTAQANRSQISTASIGTRSADAEKETNRSEWSADQLAYFKKRGLDPNKVSENLRKK